MTRNWSLLSPLVSLFPLTIMLLAAMLHDANYALQLGALPLWLLLFLSASDPFISKLKVTTRGLVRTVLGLPLIRITWQDVCEIRVRRFWMSIRTKRLLLGSIAVFPADRTGFLEAVRVAKPALPIMQR